MLTFISLLPGAGKESGGQAINLSTSYLELRRSKTLCGPECPADSSHVRNAFVSAGRCDTNGRLPQDPKLGQQIPENISWTCGQFVALYLFVAIQGPPGTVHEKRPKTVNTRLVKRALRRYRLAEGGGRFIGDFPSYSMS